MEHELPLALLMAVTWMVACDVAREVTRGGVTVSGSIPGGTSGAGSTTIGANVSGGTIVGAAAVGGTNAGTTAAMETIVGTIVTSAKCSTSDGSACWISSAAANSCELSLLIVTCWSFTQGLKSGACADSDLSGP